MFPSNLAFDFDFVLGSFFTFWGPNGPSWGPRYGSTTVLGSTHVFEQLSFSMFPSVLIFVYDLILGSFFTFWGPHELFLGLG